MTEEQRPTEHASDEHASDEHASDEPRPAPEAHDAQDHQGEEPTQPLRGWRPDPASQPETTAEPPAPGTRPMPAGPWGPPPPAPYAAPFGQPSPQPYPPAAPMHQRPRPERSRGLSAGGWVAVAAVSLLVGLVGGLAGAALVDTSGSGGSLAGGLAEAPTRSSAPLEADNGSVAAVAQALLPSTVQILAEFDGEAAGATGSGFVLDRAGNLVTNNHVVASAAESTGPIVVIDHLGERHEATVVGRSPVYDLAVLKVDDSAGLAPAALGASRVLNVGDPVVAFGAPLGLSQTVTAGIVSALGRPVTTGDSENESSYIDAVQTDAAINPGNSGGPLVNLAGEVVGVNSAIATTGGGLGGESGNIGVGFAIPIEQVRTTVDQILRTGEARYPVIGAQVRTGGSAAGEGAVITEVGSGTPAARAGLQADDLVTEVDGKAVTDGIALIVAIRTHQPGDEVSFTILRGGDEREISIVLGGEVG